MNRPRRACFPPWRAPRLALAGLWLMANAATAQSSPYSLGLSTSFGHDSNLLRLADSQAPLAGDSRSDTTMSTALVGSLDQGIGRQRLTASLALRDNRYDRNSKYDNQGYSGDLGLDWSTVGRISGALSLSTARKLSTFNAEGVGLLPEKNLETTQTVGGNIRVGVVTPLSLELGAGQRRVRNSAAQARARSVRPRPDRRRYHCPRLRSTRSWTSTRWSCQRRAHRCRPSCPCSCSRS